jgi:hypothetical protein
MPQNHQSESIRLLKQIAEGQHPGTGQRISETDVIRTAKVQQKIFELIGLMIAVDGNETLPEKPPPTTKAGSSWSHEEDRQLRAEYQRGDSIEMMAQTHRRSHGAIRSRLIKFGLIDSPLQANEATEVERSVHGIFNEDSRSIEISGKDLLSLLKKEPPIEVNALTDAEFADENTIWILKNIDPKTVTLADPSTGALRSRPIETLAEGSLYLNNKRLASRIQEAIENSRTKTDKALTSARAKLERYGFFPSDFGSDRHLLRIALCIEAHESGISVTSEEWGEFHETVTESEKPSVMRPASKLAQAMLEMRESSIGGKADLFRRITAAYLYRHTGRPALALKICDAIDQPASARIGSSTNLAVLSVLRGSSFLDLAEIEQDLTKKQKLLANARKALDRANATAATDTEHCMRSYQRLRKIETDTYR